MKKNVDAGDVLVVTFPVRVIAVSYLSNFLRTLQATLRETAKIHSDSAERLYVVPRPVLYQTVLSQDGSTVLNVFFQEGDGAPAMAQFTTEVMHVFMTNLKDFLLGNAQTHLWEYAVPESKSSHNSPLESRLASLIKEIKKYPGSLIMVDEEKITFSLNGFEVN